MWVLARGMLPSCASEERGTASYGTAARLGVRLRRRLWGARRSRRRSAAEVRVSLHHGAEDLPPSARRLNIADPNLQLPLAGLATPNEGRIQGHHDRRSAGRRRLHRHLSWERLGDLERVTAK